MQLRITILGPHIDHGGYKAAARHMSHDLDLISQSTNYVKYKYA